MNIDPTDGVFRVWRAHGLSPARGQPHGSNLVGGATVHTGEGGHKHLDEESSLLHDAKPHLSQNSSDIWAMNSAKSAAAWCRRDTRTAEDGDLSATRYRTSTKPHAKSAPRMLALDEAVRLLHVVNQQVAQRLSLIHISEPTRPY